MKRVEVVRLLPGLLLFGLSVCNARADGGVIRLRQAKGPFLVTVFTAAEPVQEGLCDVSVLVQQRDSGDAMLDATVELVFTAPAASAAEPVGQLCGASRAWLLGRSAKPAQAQLTVPACRSLASNKLLYAAPIRFGTAGRWQLEALIKRRSDTVEVACSIPVGSPPRRLISLAPYLAVPPLLVALFVLNQYLRRQRWAKPSLGQLVLIIVVSFVLGQGLAVAQATGEAERTERQPATSVIKGLSAPARPDIPWAAPDLRAFAEPLRAEHPSEIDPHKEYEVTELIDLAERAHPETKVAWARAKEAASAVGLAQSEYYPMLAVKASGNWANLPVPLPLSPNQAGYLSVEAQEAHAVAELEWVLLDFGKRAATVRAARERLLAANLGFNARHQEIVFKVQTSFYCGPFRRRPKG